MSFPRRASSGAPCGNIWSYYSRIGNTFERRSAVDFRIPTTYTSILASLSLFPSLPPSFPFAFSLFFILSSFRFSPFFFLRASHDGHRLAEPELRAPVAGERGARVASVHATFHCVRCPVRAYKAPFTLKIVIPRRRERKRKKKKYTRAQSERRCDRPKARRRSVRELGRFDADNDVARLASELPPFCRTFSSCGGKT